MRPFFKVLPALLTPVLGAVATGCAFEGEDADENEGAFSSDQATLLDFEFDAELVTDYTWNDKQTIESQLLFTIGHLNAQKSVGRLDALTVTNVRKTNEGGKTKIAYHAKLPVAWGSKTNLPRDYTFKLPRDVSTTGQEAFTNAHKTSCVDLHAHDVDAGSIWYYYRPDTRGCTLAANEIVTTRAKVTRSNLNTTGKYPEYHKLWEDNRLEIVSIFGKFEDGAGNYDQGVQGYGTFVSKFKSKVAGLRNVKMEPATFPDRPGVEQPKITMEGTLPDGKVLKVTALLVDNVSEAGADFDAAYDAVSATADLIAYNGHAGLGQNVRALAQKGHFQAGKYQVFFMNGCDTFAYVDGSLAETRAALNPDDPSGTKYMEFVTNAMPSFFMSMAWATSTIVDGFLDYAHPKTYDQLFKNIDHSEVVLVTGEEDNVFRPGMPIGRR